MKTFQIIITISFVLVCRITLAAPLNLGNTPLFAATNAPPANILFLFDDSGSMDWSAVTSETNGILNLQYVDSQDGDGNDIIRRCSLAYTHPAFQDDQYRDPDDDAAPFRDYDNYYPVPPEEASPGKGFWRARSHHYNRLYYNPSITYTPWKGQDKDGLAYTNADPLAARFNPYDAATGTQDLTASTIYYSQDGYVCQEPAFASQTSYNPARYWQWIDTDSNDEIDVTDEHTRIDISTSMASMTGQSVANRTDCIQDGGSGDTDTSDGYPTCTGQQELQNFANWFQYYRRREFTAKAAYANVVDEAGGVRMGLVTLHNNNNVKKELSLMSVDSNKTSLLDSLLQANAGGRTPLRRAAFNGYQYLACNDNSHFSNVCPQASAAEGGMCQQSFLIAMTDGHYNGGNWELPGTQNEDANNDTDFDGGEYADNYGNTLADVAMEFYEHDIASGLDDVLPVIPGVDEARHQHVTTYTVAFGVNGTLTEMPASGTDGTTFWPDPEENTSLAIPEKIDDLRHAAFNGRGMFLNANSPDELATALSDAILSIGDRASSAASVALNSSSLNSGSQLFQARFDSGDWSGQLLSFSISDGTGSQSGCGNASLGDLCSLNWDAGEVIKGQHYLNDREIITIDPSSATQGLPFQWSNMTAAQKADLKRHWDTRSSYLNDTQGEQLLEYIRGRSYPDVSKVRLRSSPLGDIVNSDPFFVGAPAFSYDFNGYAAFRASNQSRKKVVYVGSNDGMLHAFDASSGEELIAYIPGDRRLWDNLTMLASPSYATRHRYFVDGSPTVGDIYEGTSGSTWRSVLVSGMRAGGQTVFALDVTNPASSGFSESNADSLVLWEFSDEDDPDLGFTYSQPNIVRMANGKWAAIIGNGYNNSDSSGNETTATTSTTGKGYLFILFMDGPGNDGVWNHGSDYIKLEVNSGSVATPNGLATPAAVDTNGDFKVDLVYAGDLNGNLWRFDVDDTSPGNWEVSYSGNPVFIAKDGSGATQPITVRPEVTQHPGGITNGLMVLFGTGRYIDVADNTTSGTQTQTFYGIWDKNQTTHTRPTRSSGLVQQDILKEVNSSGSHCSSNDCFRIISDNSVDLTDGIDRGWYLDLYNTDGGNTSNHGERSVSNPVLRAGRIVFTTLIPSGQVCEFGGDGWVMELNFSSGGQPTGPSIDIDGDGRINENDLITVTIDGEEVPVPPGGQQSGVGIVPRPTILVIPELGIEKKYSSGSTGAVDIITERGFPDGRLSWREIH